MYNMSLVELKALEEYFNKALAKDWIQESKSLVGASILFVLQKSSKLCLYVDYYSLNTITIKN